MPQDFRREVYERLRSPAERSDILRLELLARHGGIYVDTDFECLRPIDLLLEGVELFAAEVKNGRINNAMIGAGAEHPAMLRALREVRPLQHFGAVDKYGTGPFFVDRILQEEHATVFERRLFYPTWQERNDAYAYHHMARSWKDARGYRKSIYLAGVRLASSRVDVYAGGLLGRLRIRRYELVDLWRRARRKAVRILRPHVDVARARLGVRRARTTRIPRLLHHVWLEAGDLPPDVAARLRTWAICHPDWTQRLWREDDLPSELVRAEGADLLRSPIEREELLRLELVARFGGVAADLQLACRRRMDSRITDLDAFCASTRDGEPDASLVGATAGHRAIVLALEAATPFEWHGYPSGSTGRDALRHGIDDGLVLLRPEVLDERRAIAVRTPRENSTEGRRQLLQEVIAVEQRVREFEAAHAHKQGG